MLGLKAYTTSQLLARPVFNLGKQRSRKIRGQVCRRLWLEDQVCRSSSQPGLPGKTTSKKTGGGGGFPLITEGRLRKEQYSYISVLFLSVYTHQPHFHSTSEVKELPCHPTQFRLSEIDLGPATTAKAGSSTKAIPLQLSSLSPRLPPPPPEPGLQDLRQVSCSQILP